jgi:hypothetical protein
MGSPASGNVSQTTLEAARKKLYEAGASRGLSQEQTKAVLMENVDGVLTSWFDAHRNGEEVVAFYEAVKSVGSYYVLYHPYDDDNKPQGRAIARVYTECGQESGTVWVRGQHIVAEDQHYQWWASEAMKSKLVLHFCKGLATRCRHRFREQGAAVVHVSEWRRVGLSQMLTPKWAHKAMLEELLRSIAVVRKWNTQEENLGNPPPEPRPKRLQGKGPSQRDRSASGSEAEAGVEAALARAREVSSGMQRGTVKTRGDSAGAAAGPQLETTAHDGQEMRPSEARAAEHEETQRRREAEREAATRRPLRGALVPSEGEPQRKAERDDRGPRSQSDSRGRRSSRKTPSRARLVDPTGSVPPPVMFPPVPPPATLHPDDRENPPKVLLIRATQFHDRFEKEKEMRAERKKKKKRERGGRRRRSRSRSRSRERGRRRRRSRSRSASSSGSGSSRSDSLFRKASLRSQSSLEEWSRRHPGRLLRSGLKETIPYMSARTGGLDPDEDHWSRVKMLAYTNQVLLIQYPQEKIGIRNAREVQTLARSLDLLLTGNLGVLGDMLMQRLKALEASFSDGSWVVARNQELLPDAQASLTSQSERSKAAKEELRLLKLKEALKKAKGE